MYPLQSNIDAGHRRNAMPCRTLYRVCLRSRDTCVDLVQAVFRTGAPKTHPRSAPDPNKRRTRVPTTGTHVAIRMAIRILGVARMITSTLKGANAARRRLRSLQCAAAANPPMRVAASRLPPYTTGAFNDLGGARAHAIALVVLAVHCTVALKLWRVSVEKQEYTAPHVLDLQFDVRAAVPPPAAISTQSADRAANLTSAMTSPVPAPSTSTRRARDMATPRNTTQASRSKPLAKIAPNNVSKPQPAPAATTPQPIATDAGPEPRNASTSTSPESQPTSEPLTEPSFGAAYLHNPAPTYPGVAQQRGWQGTVMLKVHVLASGRPDHVGLASSSGHESLDDAALEAVTNWRFAPARRGVQAVDGWVQVPIEFKLGT